MAQTSSPDGNPRAAQTRIKPASAIKTGGQRKHDLRIGRQPDYVDDARTHLNRVLIRPQTGAEMRKRAEERRARQPRKRAMKSNAAVSISGIVTFGHLAQDLFERLSPDQQDAAFMDLCQRLAAKLDVGLTGLVVHMDESAIHAHVQMDAYDAAGRAVSDRVKHYTLKEIQDLTAEVMAAHCPGIERGNRKKDRLRAGAKPADVVHKPPAQLRRELARENVEEQDRRDRLVAEATQLAARIAKLEALGDALTEKGARQLETAQRRLAAKQAELADLDTQIAEAHRRAQSAAERAEEVEERERASMARIEPLRAALAALDAHEARQQGATTEETYRQAVQWLGGIAKNPSETFNRHTAVLAAVDRAFRDDVGLSGDLDADLTRLREEPSLSHRAISVKFSDPDWQTFGETLFQVSAAPEASLHRGKSGVLSLASELTRHVGHRVAGLVNAAIRLIAKRIATPAPTPPPPEAKPFTDLPEDAQQAVRQAFRSGPSGPGF